MGSIVAFGTEGGRLRFSARLETPSPLVERVCAALTDVSASAFPDVACALIAEALGATRCELIDVDAPLNGADINVPLVAGGLVCGRLAMWWGCDAAVPVDRMAELEALGAVLAIAARTSTAAAAVATERERIAQDLHDSVAQVLTGIGLSLTDLLAAGPDERWQSRLLGLQQLTERATRELRAAIDGLLFQSQHDDVAAAISALCRQAQDAGRIRLDFAVRGTPHPLPAVARDALHRVAQEALANVQRHAHASTASVELSFGPRNVVLTVRDDGVGFGRLPTGAGSRHFGIQSMRRRIEQAGGYLRIGTAAPHGAVVEAVIPGRKVTAHAAHSGGPRR